MEKGFTKTRGGLTGMERQREGFLRASEAQAQFGGSPQKDARPWGKWPFQALGVSMG